MKLLVSITCITFNQESYIAEAIESFLMQKTNFDFEIIIGEDCSTDGTRKIIEEYRTKFPEKIKLITSSQNVGMMHNFFRTLHHSKGKYIAICEGDDYWTDSYKLQKQVDYMESNTDCSLYVHTATIIKEKKSTGRFVRPSKHDYIFSIEDVLSNSGGFFATPSLLFPKRLLDDLPEFFTDAPVGDYPLTMILAHKGYIYFKDEPMAAYRTGISGSWTENLWTGSHFRQKIIQNIEQDILILKGFDLYTNHEYSTHIQEAIDYKQAYQSLMKKEFSILNNYFKDKHMFIKLMLLSYGLFPKIYKKVRELQFVEKWRLQLRNASKTKYEG